MLNVKQQVHPQPPARKMCMLNEDSSVCAPFYDACVEKRAIIELMVCSGGHVYSYSLKLTAESLNVELAYE